MASVKNNNFPTSQQPDVSGAELTKQVQLFAELKNWKPCTSDEEVEERIQQYFEFCAAHSLRPGVESLCLALGVRSRQTLLNWQAKGGRRGQAIDRAKAVITSLLEAWFLNGRIHPVTGIFLLKNWAGYKDQTEIELSPRLDLEPTKTLAEIERDIPIDDFDDDIPDDFTDDIPEY